MYKAEDYTVEWCPYCEGEQVIFSSGVTACPECEASLTPCSMCKECVRTECPYGCIGSDEDKKMLITNRIITKEEAGLICSSIVGFLRQE